MSFLAGSLTLEACLPIPHRHTQRAGARFHVTDQTGRSVSTAVVNVYEGSIIGGTLKRIATARTDSSGIAIVERDRSWHLVMIFIPDAEAPSVFGWCVESPGFEPLGRPMEDEAHQALEARLQPTTTSTKCPERLERYKLEQGHLVEPAA